MRGYPEPPGDRSRGPVLRAAHLRGSGGRGLRVPWGWEAGTGPALSLGESWERGLRVKVRAPEGLAAGGGDTGAPAPPAWENTVHPHSGPPGATATRTEKLGHAIASPHTTLRKGGTGAGLRRAMSCTAVQPVACSDLQPTPHSLHSKGKHMHTTVCTQTLDTLSTTARRVKNQISTTL